MNSKYLSGLLAGVLTAGAVQGSGNGERMPRLGEEQTPEVHAQTANELPAELRRAFLAFSQSLTERGYRARIDLSSVQMPTQTTRIILNPKSRLECRHMCIVQEHMGYVKTKDGKTGNSEDLKKIIQVSKKFADQPKLNEINTIPITEANKGLFPQLKTQNIFSSKDYIIPNVEQYIVTYPITKKKIGELVVRIKNKRNDVATDKKLIIVKCQKIKESDLVGGILSGEKPSWGLVPEEDRCVDVKSRKRFSQVLMGGSCILRDLEVLKIVSEAFEKGIEFEKIILDEFKDYFLRDFFPKLNKKNVHSFEFFIKDAYDAKMPSDWVIFFMGCSKCLHVPYLKRIDCEKDLFVVSKQLGLDPYTHAMEFEDKPGCDVLEFYAPFLEETARVDNRRKHTTLYLPCVKKFRNPSLWTPKCHPNAIYVSPDFDASPFYGRGISIKRYTPEQLEKIEMAKEELLAYIAINPELSNASLNCPKPDSVDQKKWDDLINLKNKLMALLRGEDARRIIVFQME